MNKRDKEQLAFWKNIIAIVTTMEQQEIDALNIDQDKEAAAKINHEKYKWLLDNWQLIRPSISTINRRVPVNIFNINKKP